MQKIATQLLSKNLKGDLDELRTQVKTTESSNWYKPGAKARASKAGQDGGTGRWCTNCESGTHNTAFCFGKCFICKGFGHKAAQCRNRNDTGPPNVGGGKKAGADTGAGAEPGAGAEKLSKAARRRQNQAKRKEEEERLKAEAEKAAKAASVKTFTASDSEEDSPKRPVYAARQARLTGGKSRSLYKELNAMTDGNVEKLGEEIFRAYAARATEVDDSATTVGRAYARLTGGKGCHIPII